MIKYTGLALALVGAAGVGAAGAVQAQTSLDPYGRPMVSSQPQPTPGDYSRERAGPQPMDQQAQAVSPYRGHARHDEAFKDEYGFRYDERGNRIDGTGRRISPHTTTP
jgi:hypothetical protein